MATGLLAGKAVLVAGAGRGIGEAAARLFAAEGARVMLLARTADELEAVRQAIVEDGGAAVTSVGDVRDPGAVGAAVQRTVAEFGSLDGAFNNAGAARPPTGLLDVTAADFDYLVGVNLTGVLGLMQAEIAAMTAAGTPGSIVNNSSVGSLYGNGGRAVYSAAKRAVNSLTATAAVEFGPQGIRVNAIAPGTTLTPLVRSWSERDPTLVPALTARTPLRRAAEPDEVAEAALWLLSDRSSYVTGTVLRVDGGLHA
jgi:NAD(P)-dependent dehydrogenase (short-subunit alcohol dehydrogenase family)